MHGPLHAQGRVATRPAVVYSHLEDRLLILLVGLGLDSLSKTNHGLKVRVVGVLGSVLLSKSVARSVGRKGETNGLGLGVGHCDSVGLVRRSDTVSHIYLCLEVRMSECLVKSRRE